MTPTAAPPEFPPDLPPDALLATALDHHQAGRLDRALALYEAVLAQDPCHAEALHLSGVALMMNHKPVPATRRLRAALATTPGDAEMWRSLASVGLARGDEALALKALRRALAVRPGFVAALLTQGSLLTRQGAFAEAEALYARLPDSLDAQHRRAAVLLEMNEPLRALEVVEGCLALEPSPSASSLTHQGLAFAALDRLGEAASVFRHALAVDPGALLPLVNLAVVLCRAGAWRDAVALLDPAGQDVPAVALLAACLLPRVARDAADLAAAHHRMRAALDALRARQAFLPDPNAVTGVLALPWLTAQEDALSSLASSPPAHAQTGALAHAQTGALARAQTGALADALAETVRQVCPALGFASAGATRPPATAPGAGRQRVAVVLPPWRRSVALDALALLITGLHARDDLDLVLVSVGPPGGDIWTTLAARGKAPPLIVIPRDVLRGQKALGELGVDGVFFIEVGVDPWVTALAHGRHAPLQVVLGCHPVSPGLASIDCFLGSALMEGPGARSHYRETLIRLPGLPLPVPPLPVETADRARLTLPEDRTLYLCPAPLWRLSFETDALFARILREDPRGVLCFMRPPEAESQKILTQRLDAQGLPGSRLLWIRRTRPDIHRAALKAVDVVLDPLGWSGGFSSVEALSVGTPVVTLPGRRARSRRTSGLYALLGLPEAPCKSLEAYARLAVSLGREKDKRHTFQAALRDKLPRLLAENQAVDAVAAVLTGLRPPKPPAVDA